MRFLIILFVLLTTVSCGDDSTSRKKAVSQFDAVRMLESAPINPIQLKGRLSDIFMLGSDYTNLQRDNMERDIVGQIVQWNLPVYEISPPTDGVYRIATQSESSTPKLLAATVYITARNDRDRELLHSLKTNDIVSFKGRVSAIRLRLDVEVDPAILVYAAPVVLDTPKNEESTKRDGDRTVAEPAAVTGSESMSLSIGPNPSPAAVPPAREGRTSESSVPPVAEALPTGQESAPPVVGVPTPATSSVPLRISPELPAAAPPQSSQGKSDSVNAPRFRETEAQ